MHSRFRERLRYRFENFMAKGGRAIFISLLVLFVSSFILLVLLKLGVGLLETPVGGKTAIPPLGDERFHWDILMQLMDTGAVAGAEGLLPRVVGIVATLLGVVIFSMLIAFITTQLEKTIYNFRKGRSWVLESGHTLILGWNDRVVEIIRELVIANESEKYDCVVILAEADKEEMDDAVHKRLPDTKTTRVVTRSGDPASMGELKRVNAAGAKSAIILASCSENAAPEEREDSDVRSMKTIMALVACQEGRDFPVIAELFSPERRSILSCFESDKIISVDSQEILGKLLVQTSLTSGLEVVYNELLSFDGCEIYFYEAEWGGIAFGELACRFADGIPIGIRQTDGTVVTRPPADHRLQPGEQILIVAQDDSTIEFRKNPVAVPGTVPVAISRSEQKKRRILILGWHGIGKIIAREYADFLKEGSLLDVMLPDPTAGVREMIRELDVAHPGLDIRLLEGDPLQIGDLERVEPFGYDNVIILSQSEAERSSEKMDSETFMILLLLRKLGRGRAESGQRTKIITQILNPENQELIAQTDVDDFIISNRLITMILAQLSEQPEMKKLYDSLFQEEGSEIYVKPATLYFNAFPVTLSFIELMTAAAARDEICLGVRLGKLSRDGARNFGVVLDPPKKERFTLTADDYLVVLAEDEL